MPTLNLGRVRFNWRGEYDPLVSYLKYDVVTSDGQSYVCIADVTGTGPHDTGGGSYWEGTLLRGADYNAARDEAVQAASDASNSATAAGEHATAAGESATTAAGSEEMAERWANEAEDVEVSPGLFSAYHWMRKAQAFGDPNEFDLTADQTADTRKAREWMAQVLANQQKASDNETAIGERAKLAGGADANFTAMPQVGGDPIVESGSNSDGHWTRWADGTQRITGVVTVPSVTIDTASGSLYQSSTITLPYPMPFVSVSHSNAFKSSGAGSLITAFGATLFGARTEEISFRYIASVSRAAEDIPTAFSADGRWK